MRSIVRFVKSEIVLTIATILAIVSMFFVMPDKEYVGYIDFRTLGILFCLMAVMEGLNSIKVFEILAQKLLRKVKNIWQLVIILTSLCFFSSMLITNDVALITFVPLTLIVLNMLDEHIKNKYLIPIVVMQTVAANLGSMLTPIGNPQNLYLYSQSEMGILEFIMLMLPYTVIAFVIILVWSVLVSKGIRVHPINVSIKEIAINNKKRLSIYSILFLMCILTVARILPYEILTIIVLVLVLIIDRKVLFRVDYSLLCTFVAFFVFIGNMGRLDVFSSFLELIINENEMLTAVASSQIISNVPAALLLSGFTDNYKALIVGTNLGGLGTLIASMASLISFKYIAKDNNKIKGKYMAYFTFANLVILIILLLFEILWTI